MSGNRKYEILLIQLPPPEFEIKKYWGNVPFAAGYFKSMAYKERLLDKVNIEILGEKDTGAGIQKQTVFREERSTALNEKIVTHLTSQAFEKNPQENKNPAGVVLAHKAQVRL